MMELALIFYSVTLVCVVYGNSVQFKKQATRLSKLETAVAGQIAGDEPAKALASGETRVCATLILDPSGDKLKDQLKALNIGDFSLLKALMDKAYRFRNDC